MAKPYSLDLRTNSLSVGNPWNNVNFSVNLWSAAPTLRMATDNHMWLQRGAQRGSRTSLLP
jgi:hypothetical protein